MNSSLIFEDDVVSSTASLLDFIVEEQINVILEDVATDATGAAAFVENTSINEHVLFGSGLGPVRDPYVIVIPITILYAVVFFTGVVGNAVTCIVIARNKHMRTATNYYLFSLAVSDLLLLVSGLPQEMYSIWSRYPYVFGEVFCVLRGLAAETSTNASVLTITAFTVERYVAICHPFLSHTMSKLSRAVKLILAIWVVALAFAIPQAIQFGLLIGDTPDYVICTVKQLIMKHSFEVATFLFFVAPMTLITVLYVLIGLRLRRSNMMKSSGSFSKKSSTSTNPCPGGLQEGSHAELTCTKSVGGRHYNSQSSRRVLKMLVAVVVAFFICWAPFHAQRLVAIYGTDEDNKPSTPIMLKIYSIVTYVSGILYYVSTTINPILYHIMSLKFREAFKDTLARCCGFGGIKGRRTRRSYSVLSRSGGQRLLGATAGGVTTANGQESTEYSANSVREDYLASNGTTTTHTGGGLSGLRKKTSSENTSSSCRSANCWTGHADNSAVRTDSVEYRRTYSVVLHNEGDVRTTTTTVIPPLDRQSAQNSQLPLLAAPKNRDPDRRAGQRKGREISGGAKRFWRILKCASSSVDQSRRLSSSYSPAVEHQERAEGGPADQEEGGTCHINVMAPGETFNLLPVGVCRSFSNNSVTSNAVSNSSLRDVDRGALEDELTSYMEELHRRERC